MKIPTKVIIEITADGYATKVFSGDELIKERSHTMNSAGHSTAKQAGEFYDDFEDFEEFAESLEDLSFGPFDIASQLFRIREDFN